MAVSREPEFRTTRMREGYDLDAVDDFVDVVIDALDGRSAARGITPEQIEAEEFKVVRMREGYVMDDVDDWLDAAASELRTRRKAAAQQPQQHQQVPANAYAQGPGLPPGGSGMPSGAPGMGAAPVAPVSPPPVAPPVMPPPAAGGYGAPTGPAGPPSNPSYPAAYYDTSHGTSHGTSQYDTQAYDPLTDSAVNELDPVLRALDTSYGSSPPPAAPQQQEQYQRAPEPSADDASLAPSSTPSTGLHHIEVWVRDLDAATRSFGWLFERLGWTLFQAWENGRSWQAPGGGPYVVIECSPDLSWVAYDRKAPGLNHLALAVPEQWMVDRIVSEAPAYGWHLMFADRHPHAGGPHHYAAYMENDDGYEVEVVAP
ncbi:DivIVA domain-containing protein [Jiangella alkaliphila]|uniref:DivIVA domain-containing protein n=1 Tax=Jiangella alkaliphila TaxID=419479 RepID=A0A1H2L7A0_9ACTN|nr:DivIVA domain-containing protein [Jiangella alkaliphila]SDU76448.1 DivIVA domain-containing protein [Jiangella alkaliphila]